MILITKSYLLYYIYKNIENIYNKNIKTKYIYRL